MNIERTAVHLSANPRRVIARLFIPGGEGRVAAILDRILALTDGECTRILNGVMDRYRSRHGDVETVFRNHYDAVAAQLNGRAPEDATRRLLIGAYFTSEYSLESVALFNPSMVPHPVQSGPEDGPARFIMSLRACGEGHISSIEFRSGTIDGDITFDATTEFAAARRPVDDHAHDKNRFYLKLQEIGAYRPMIDPVVEALPDAFTIEDLEQALQAAGRRSYDVETFKELAEAMRWVAHSSYRLEFPVESDLSERVIFPVTENESRGIEDARFVRFVDTDGEITYYATCTAYNGVRALPQIIQTSDFRRFRINTLNGRCAQSKGMALFPRKLADRFAMMSRMDGENLFVLRSDDVHFWNEYQMVQGPMLPWEFVQIGNCGSPIETKEGWLLLTHGVGPMREYWMGALLLDLEDPSRVIGHLTDPLLMPTEEERNGYVPNVVYSCGAMTHGDKLVIPYGISDTSTSVAIVSLSELLSHLTRD